MGGGDCDGVFNGKKNWMIWGHGVQDEKGDETMYGVFAIIIISVDCKGYCGIWDDVRYGIIRNMVLGYGMM